MSKMRTRMASAALVGVMGLALAACGGGGDSESADKLVIYSPNAQHMLDAIIPAFEDKTGIDVSVVSAGTGELYQRIKSEGDNPNADVMFGGSAAQAVQHADLWADYVSKHDDSMLPVGKNLEGSITPYQADGSNLLINTDIGAKYNITAYADLLNPELKGKIAFGDPSDSSSAFAQLTNILKAMGGYESEEAWDYVTKLVDNLDGVTIGSSSQVVVDTVNAEYAVALTYEAKSANAVAAGKNVKMVYPKEGAVFLPAGSQIIKNAKHPEAAKKFIDFTTSEEGQNIIATKTSGRPLRKGVNSDGLKPLEEINSIKEDSQYVSSHRDEIIDRYQKIFAAAQ